MHTLWPKDGAALQTTRLNQTRQLCSDNAKQIHESPLEQSNTKQIATHGKEHKDKDYMS